MSSAEEPPLSLLRQFARRQAAVEHCDICGLELAPEHEHLIEPATGKLQCACSPCAILFSDQQNGRYRRVPRRIVRLPAFQLTDELWESMYLPINLAFFLRKSTTGKITALYPSPAGATESTLSLEAWQDLEVANPILGKLESDVETLLVNRTGPAREYFIAPIDECFKLVGLIRTHWRGLSGGTEVWKEIGKFFASLRERSSPAERRPMPDLNFQVENAEPVPFSETPMLAFKLRITQANGETPIHTIALRCQIRIEPTKRKYEPPEQERLHDLFGEPARWGQTLRSMLWTHTTSIVKGFTGSTLVDLNVPCTFDFNVAATKYFHALADGVVPLLLLFSGSIFYEAEHGHLQITQISWEKETSFRLPVAALQALMDHYYPNCAWLALRRDVFDRLARYKSRCGLPTWETALEKLLPEQQEGAQS